MTYKYITGDVNEIQIDGQIMPLRDDDEKKIMRGEDIVFCMEVLRRRASNLVTASKCTVNGTDKWNLSQDIQKSNFSQKVCYENFRDIVEHGLHGCCYNPQYTVGGKGGYVTKFCVNFLKSMPAVDQYHQETTHDEKPFDKFFLEDTFDFYHQNDQQSNHEKFKHGKPIKLSHMQDIFDDIQNLDKVAVHVNNYGAVIFNRDDLQIQNLDKYYDGKEEPQWPEQAYVFGYYMLGHKKSDYYIEGSNYYYSYYGSTKPITIEVDTDTLSENQSIWVEFRINYLWNGDSRDDYETKSFTILKRVSTSPSFIGDKLTFNFSIDKTLIDSIADDCEIELKEGQIPQGEARYAKTVEQILSLTFGNVYIVGEVSQDTKWVVPEA